MMKKLKFKDTKKCPRCGEKCLISSPSCPSCGLVFSRLTRTSNKEGKKAVLKFKRNEYFLSNIWPADANRIVALILCLLFGYVGAHNFYLGRFFKGLFSLVMLTIVLLSATFLTSYLYYDLVMTLIAIPGSFITIFWVMDSVNISIGKYKIPVALKQDKKEKNV